MRLLAAVQSVLAVAFILFGLVVLLGIGITGLLFLLPGAVFAVSASLMQQESRAAVAVALAADTVLVFFAARKLAMLFTSEASAGAAGAPGFFDYLVPAAALVLVGIGALAVLKDRRALCSAPWF